MRAPTSFRTRALLAAGLAVAGAGAGAQPALAHATISLRAPGVNQQLTSRSATVSADLVVGTHTASSTEVDRVDMTLDQLWPTGHAQVKASAAPSGSSVSFPVDLPRNGRYKVSVSAPWSHSGLFLGGDQNGTAADAREFFVAVPPASPTAVKTAVDGATRGVTLTWKANTEPDLLFYVIQRAKGTSNEFSVVGRAEKAAEPRFADASTAEAGGEYRYQVVAVRNGVKEGEGISSDPSALSPEATAAVPDPPPPPTTAPPATPEAAAGTPGTTIAAQTSTGGGTGAVPANSPGALTTSGTVDLRGFTAVQSQSRRAAPRAAEPDPGFLPTLPFAPRTGDEEVAEEGGELGEVAADSPQFREIGAEEESDNRQETMMFFAAGLLATVLLMHVLWVKSEVKRVPLEAVAPEGPKPVARRDDLVAGPAKPRRGRSGRARASDPLPDWFIPDRLGVDEVVTEREKVGAGS